MPALGEIRTFGRYRSRGELEAEIIRLRKSGMTQAAIGHAVYVSPTTVWKILRQQGIIHERVETWSVLSDLSGVVRDKHGVLTKQQAVDKLIAALEVERDEIRRKLHHARVLGYKLARKSNGSKSPAPS